MDVMRELMRSLKLSAGYSWVGDNRPVFSENYKISKPFILDRGFVVFLQLKATSDQSLNAAQLRKVGNHLDTYHFK